MEDYFYNLSLLVHDLLEQDEPVSNYVRDLYEIEIDKIAMEPDQDEHVVSREFSNLLTQVLIYKILSRGLGALTAYSYLEKCKLEKMKRLD